MKKYIKPSVEVVEANLAANYLMDASDTYTTDPAYAPGKSGKNNADARMVEDVELEGSALW